MPKGKRKNLGNAKRYKKIVVPKTVVVVGGIVLYSTARVTDATGEEGRENRRKKERNAFLDEIAFRRYVGGAKK
jgi:hypothetical protein